MDLQLRVIGRVESPLTETVGAPKQPDEDAPGAWLVFDPDVADALDGLRAGTDVVVLTWLDRADRSVLRAHPRGDDSRPLEGVFVNRSPHRPNPIGLHETHVDRVEGRRVHVTGLEAIDGTPILDLKPVLGPAGDR